MQKVLLITAAPVAIAAPALACRPASILLMKANAAGLPV